MKTKKFFAGIISIGMLMTPLKTVNTLSAYSAIQEGHSSYVDEFFELPLSEIESQLNVTRSEANTSQIVVDFSNEQLRKLITELEPQKEKSEMMWICSVWHSSIFSLISCI